ncbi:S-adenosylmethionine uptake transporter [Rhizobium sp. ERR 922]|uniref:DMT family transporter n=1 Tax=unclassified Rhizobium TaxID=2613769 RepID=UPI0011A45231|nr:MULTISPECIES: DMT family transporter [unclassified Rhizobium]TWB61494.1 S-adenosylmethionine uptake transporter [Rhizobium sp. ERR 922]TWC04420.1 S-adenosylmethionine uptake transporter [Rhizobium sp. ERR 942]
MSTSSGSSVRLPQSELTFGLSMMFLSVILSPVIDIFSKLAAATIPPGEVTAARFIFQALFALPIMAMRWQWGVWTWRRSGVHAIRAAMLTLSMVSFVTTLQVMEVADAIAIFFVEPMMLTILSSIFLKETIGWRRYTACAVGFFGAMLIIQPSFQEVGFIALLPVVTALCIAIYVMITRVVSHSEDAWSMQFQTAIWGTGFSLILLVIGRATGAVVLDPVIPDLTAMLYLLGVGATAAAAGILTVYAYRAVPASTLAPLQYFEIVSATIFGWLVFDNFPDAIKWLGIVIIIGSGLYILWRERRFASKPVSDTSETAFTP